jgi:hypothetical protein
MIVEIFYTVVIFYLGWVLGQTYQILKMQELVKATVEKYQVDLESIATVDAEVMILSADLEGDTILIYDKLTSDFICQAGNLDSAAELFNHRKPNTVGALVYNDKPTYFVNGKVTYNTPS